MNTSWHIRPHRQRWPGYRSLFPGLAGIILLASSLLPWYSTPAGPYIIAWQQPVEIGWQIHSGIFNYGLLTMAGAIYIFYIAYKAWQMKRYAYSDDPATMLQLAKVTFTRHLTLAALLCLVPSLLYTYQFLCADLALIEQYTHIMNQLQLTQSHFGYATNPRFIQIQPFLFNPLHFSGRWALLVDRVGCGYFMPLISALILLGSRRLFPVQRIILSSSYIHRWQPQGKLLAGLILIALLLLGRAPAALVCVAQAEHLLGTGTYQGVTRWLNAARVLNPDLDLLPAYHQLRGQADYYATPHDLSTEGHIYLASYYRAKYDTLSSYQEVLTAWNTSPHTTWIQDEMFLSLAQLIESTKPVHGLVARQVTTNIPAVRWLNEIVAIDPKNFYAYYMLGRISCDIQAYQDCKAQMQRVLQLNSSSEVRSSAYGYLATSEFGLGNDVAAREDLFSAQRNDKAYRNNPARQRMSGMR